MTIAWRVTSITSLLLVAICVALVEWPVVRNAPWSVMVIWAVLALLVSALQLTRLSTSSASVSLTSIMLGAAIIVSGPLAAALVGCVSALEPLRSRALLVRLFNVAMNGLVGVLGGLAYLALGGLVQPRSPLLPLTVIARQLLPLAGATVVMLLVNTGCVGLMVALTGDTPVLLAWRRLARQVGRTYLGYGVVGFLFAVLWEAVGLGPATILVMATPLLLAQWSYYQQQAESTAHERTVSSLVAAGEARDPIMRGRNERVAKVSELIGNELRLSPTEADALHFAALLHDVGMVAPVEGRHTEDEGREGDLERIRRHPSRGVEMLRSIEFLGDSITAIRHHHERWDGRGYPAALAGPAIPQLARILAVADTFCALAPRLGVVSTVEVLRERSGTQFDPDCVAALVEVAESAHGFAIESVSADVPGLDLTSEARWVDHDLPEISDLLAFGARRL